MILACSQRSLFEHIQGSVSEAKGGILAIQRNQRRRRRRVSKVACGNEAVNYTNDRDLSFGEENKKAFQNRDLRFGEENK